MVALLPFYWYLCNSFVILSFITRHFGYDLFSLTITLVPFVLFLYDTHMASKPHREATAARGMICRNKIVKVHETYRRSVEMCFEF